MRSLGDADHVALKDAELVFVGYGIVAPEHGWDDYRDVDVKGKIVVLLNFNPPWAGEGVRLWYGRWDYKYLEAARHGAAGALHDPHHRVGGLPVAGGRDLQRRRSPSASTATPIRTCRSRAGSATRPRPSSSSSAGADLDRDEQPRERPQGLQGRLPLGVTASLDMPVAHERIESANVMGLLPGTDPKLRAEAVLYTAHHDHLGVRKPARSAGEHNIYNGARRQRLGLRRRCSTIARALRRHAARRSVVVAFVAAEEQGLLGLVTGTLRTPPSPPGSIAADINIDGINIYGTTTRRRLPRPRPSTDRRRREGPGGRAGAHACTATPSPTAAPSTAPTTSRSPGSACPARASAEGPTFVGRRPGWGKEQVEHFERDDYHQPSDVYPPSPQAWDLTGAVEDAQLQLLIGRRVGNDPALPEWKPGTSSRRRGGRRRRTDAPCVTRGHSGDEWSPATHR